MRQVALNYEDNLGRVVYACVGTALIFVIWSNPWLMAGWAIVGIVFTAVGDRLIRPIIDAPPDETADLDDWRLRLLGPRLAFLVNWTALLVVGWDRDRPATYLFAFLFVMATLAQNAVTSSVYAPMLIGEIAPKVAGAIGASTYWWIAWGDDTDIIFGSSILIAVFYVVFVVRMSLDLRRAAHAQIELSVQLLEGAERTNQALRQRDAPTATVVHEIRNPLTVLVGELEMIQARDDGGDVQPAVERMSRSTEVLLRIVNGVLAEAVAPDRTASASLESIGPAAVTSRVVEMLAPGANQSGLALSLRCGEVPPRFVTDVRRLQQVLINLIGNAIKFTDQGSVDVVLERAPDDTGRVMLRWTVSDSGPGLPESTGRLFEAFERGEGSTQPGTGLGLAAAREHVRVLGGRIGASPADAGGAAFWFELPDGDA